MDLQAALNVALAAGMAVSGWFARELWSAVKELRGDLSKLREELARDYPRKDELRDVLGEIKAEVRSGFQRLHDKLDGKVDKN